MYRQILEEKSGGFVIKGTIGRPLFTAEIRDTVVHIALGKKFALIIA